MCGIIWHLGGPRRVQNTPTGSGNNLPTLFEIFETSETYCDFYGVIYGHQIQNGIFGVEVGIE